MRANNMLEFNIARSGTRSIVRFPDTPQVRNFLYLTGTRVNSLGRVIQGGPLLKPAGGTQRFLFLQLRQLG